MQKFAILFLGFYIFPIITHMACYLKFKILIDIILSIKDYLFFMPAFVFILNIYALCNVDDLVNYFHYC